MLDDLLDTGVAAIRSRLVLCNGDLDDWPAYEDPLVADWYRHLVSVGVRTDVFRRGLCADPRHHYDLVLLPGNGSFWGIELKLWLLDIPFNQLRAWDTDLDKLRNGQCAERAFAVWATGQGRSLTTRLAAIRTGLRLPPPTRSGPRLPCTFNGVPCDTTLWLWQL